MHIDGSDKNVAISESKIWFQQNSIEVFKSCDHNRNTLAEAASGYLRIGEPRDSLKTARERVTTNRSS